jgi:phage shock protein A
VLWRDKEENSKPNYHYKERLLSCQQLNKAYVNKLTAAIDKIEKLEKYHKANEKHHKAHHEAEDRAMVQIMALNREIIELKARGISLNNSIDVGQTSLREAKGIIDRGDRIRTLHIARIGELRKVVEEKVRELRDLKGKYTHTAWVEECAQREAVELKLASLTKALRNNVLTLEQWKSEAMKYEKEYKNYKSQCCEAARNVNTLRRQVSYLHKTISNKEIEIAATIAAGKMADAIDKEILTDAMEKAKCSPAEDYAKQPQASGTIATGYKNTCPDCGKVWRTVVPYNEKQRCIKCTRTHRELHNATREAGNVCPACKKINHTRSAKNNPLGLCQDCFQSKKATTDLISKPNHYNWHPSGVECKDIVSEFCYNKGTAIAYIWRSEHKGTEEADLKKAIQHLQFEIDGMGDNK